MPVDLTTALAPDRTAVLTMELQRGVCGDLATIPALAEAVLRGGVVAATARLLHGARTVGAGVVHCTFSLRADRAGTSLRAPLLARAARDPAHLLAGSPAVELLPGVGPEPADVVAERHHGYSPFTATSLDVTLRNLGVEAVVVVGVSLNLGIVGAVIEAANLGYRVVVPVDAVVGMPAEYGEAVLRNTIAAVAHVTTVDGVLAAWGVTAATAT